LRRDIVYGALILATSAVALQTTLAFLLWVQCR